MIFLSQVSLTILLDWRKIVHNYEKTDPEVYGKVGNQRGKDCPVYKKPQKEEYLKNPAEYYYNTHKDFYKN